MATTQQDATGQWKLIIRHDKAGIVIPATFTYNNISVSFNITNTDQTIENTGWYTTLGEAIDLNSVNMVFTPVEKNGKTYIVKNTEFEVIPYEGGDDPTISISLSPTSVNAEGGSNVATLRVRSNTGWTITNTASFITLSQTAGTGDVDIQVSVGEYTNTSSNRTATFTGKTVGDNQKTATATLTQKKAAGEEPRISLSVSPSTISSAGGNNVAVLSVESNTGWTITKNANFATLGQTEGTGDVQINVNVTQNTDSSNSRTVTFTGKTTGSNQKTATTTLTQRKASGSTPSEDYLVFSPTSKHVESGATSFVLAVSSNTSWTTVLDADWIGLDYNSGTGEKNITVSVAASNDYEERIANILGYIGTTQKANCEIAQSPMESEDPPKPEYSLTVSIADGYDSTIDSSGTTKLIATYHDGLGGSTAVTDIADWLINTGAGYIDLDSTTDPVTVTGRGNATEHTQETKVMARYVNLTAEIKIYVLPNPIIPPFVELEDEDDLTHFQNLPCLGLPSPGYEVRIASNVAWRARLSDIDDEYWLHVSYNATTVTVYIDENVDPYSGEGGAPRTSSFIIEAVDSELEIPSITIEVSQASCPDRINIPNKDAFVFTCDGPTSYTRTIEAWDDVEWRIEPVYGEYQTEEWFSVSPTTGTGDGTFTVSVLTDNYDNLTRGSGYLRIYTGSSQTYVDWDINVRQEPTPFFEVTGTTAHFASDGGSATVRVETNKPITATTSESWIKDLTVGNNVRVVGGKSYTDITFTVDENASREDGRTGIITITSTYDGPCGPLGPATVNVIQDASTATTATFIHIRKITEPATSWHQDIEYDIHEADASTTSMDFVIWADGKCRLDSFTKDFVTDIQVLMVNGSIEVDVTDGTPFDLIGTATFRVVYGQAFIGTEKSLALRFEVNEPGSIVSSDEKATLELTQERDYPVGVTGVSFENFGPHIVPSTDSCCDWLLTEMWVEVYAETLYKSGYRTHSSEAINNYIKREGNKTGVDENILTLEVTNNPSSGRKYCYTGADDLALADELHGGSYYPTYDYPFKIQFSPNTGTTTTSDPYADGFRRDVNFHLEYNDVDGNHAEKDFTVRVPYCNPPEPETQEVYLIDGDNDLVDELNLNPGGIGTRVELRLTGLTPGETKLSFDCSESITSSILDGFEIQNESFDATSPINQWTATVDSPTIAFTRRTNDDFRFDIFCNRDGYEEKHLMVWFDAWE